MSFESLSVIGVPTRQAAPTWQEPSSSGRRTQVAGCRALGGRVCLKACAGTK